MKVTFATTKQYLYWAVGEAKIRRSDILFAFPRFKRQDIEDAITKNRTTYWFDIFQSLQKSGKPVDEDELKMYLELRDARVALGDMYETIREIERILHGIVKESLHALFGIHWWAQAIPAEIRKKCEAYEKKAPTSDPFRHTSFGQLVQILDDQWEFIFREHSKDLARDKRKFLADLKQIQNVRNRVMHPVRDAAPIEDEFALVRDFVKLLKSCLPLRDAEIAGGRRKGISMAEFMKDDEP